MTFELNTTSTTFLSECHILPLSSLLENCGIIFKPRLFFTFFFNLDLLSTWNIIVVETGLRWKFLIFRHRDFSTARNFLFFFSIYISFVVSPPAKAKLRIRFNYLFRFSSTCYAVNFVSFHYNSENFKRGEANREKIWKPTVQTTLKMKMPNFFLIFAFCVKTKSPKHNTKLM